MREVLAAHFPALPISETEIDIVAGPIIFDFDKRGVMTNYRQNPYGLVD